MDLLNNCWNYIRNDRMKEGDVYLVKSDRYLGDNPAARRPAECVTSINMMDRQMTVRLISWWCREPYKEPFLALYDNCHSEMTKHVVKYIISILH